MGKIAIVFSGQGAQYPGMGKSLYECSSAARSLYDYAQSYRPGTMEQSFSGTAEELKQTCNTQPCLYLVDLCAALALKQNGLEADGVAGFCLGEIAALAYAGAFSPQKGFEIVCERGKFMQEASEKYDTAMAAVLKVDSKCVEELCADIDNIYPVNYNSPLQTVVSGSKQALDAFKEKALQSGSGARVLDLPVSAAFHSPYMDEAAAKFSEFLSKIQMLKPTADVYSNYNAKPYGDDVFQTLTRQMNNPVRWTQTITQMISDGYTDFIEAGAGKTLCGLIKKISPEVRVYSVEDAESLKNTVEAVKADA